VKLQVKIAEALQPLTEALIIEAHNDQKNIVVEGIHLLPSYVAGYIQKYSAKAVFVGWKDSEMVLIGMKQNDKPNDWLKEANAAVRRQVADFTVAFSEYIEPEAKKYGITYIERKEDFAKD
jgi:2-phosphoglycerate kinase